MKTYSRAELQETMDMWLEANRNAQNEGNWIKYLGPMYTEDAEYTWNMGPAEEFEARGRKQIEEFALGIQMEGFQGWSYPYDRVLIDETLGEVVGFWRQVAPIKRKDGSTFEVAGTGGSWFRYGGDHKWSWQRDFFDLGNVITLLGEVAAAGGLNQTLKSKIHRVALGKGLPGHVPLKNGATWADRVKGKLALARIGILGR